ncbi:MAG TPA: alpha/beta hydrolase [Patescibacteria group bacterium]|nr:alpha/beta hydrolase [Patescibacteria group bacterium]
MNSSRNNSQNYQNTPNQTINVGETKFVYRKLGSNTGVPVIFLNHLGATLDNCDPRIMDGIATKHQLIAFDNRGVGGTGGTTPTTIAEMAKDAINFIKALGYEKVDIVSFSMGAFITQEILLQEPRLVRKVIMTGTGPAGGEGIENVTKVTYIDMLRGYLTCKDPKFYLFFNQNKNGKRFANEFLGRLKERTENRDKKIKLKSFSNQLKAIHAWGLQKPQDLSVIKQQTLIANGDNDRMVPSSNTYDLAKRISNSELVIYKDSGHGGLFQYHEDFVKKALEFLN